MHLLSPTIMVKEYAQLLAYVVHADGKIDSEEWVEFVTDMATMNPNVSPEFLKKMLVSPGDLDDLLESADLATLRTAVRDGYYLAHVDGNVDVAEEELIKKITKAAGMSDEHLERIKEWVHQGEKWVKRGLELVTD
ncbi:MAG: hypothetical protein CMB77_05060 [Euryarchaeota archaeon]|nr:hypothetical protein [Euryarchaeota archaeon]MBG17705.1 hypothetical protein [Euryarchaeota archaeon]